ncbi:MAG: STAS domain-containing protein [Planctomycetota bacterium]|jgi:anti-anti-sigma factor
MAESDLLISRIGDVTVVNFRNTSILDSAAVEAIAEQLNALIDTQAQRKLVLDFSEVKFLSSAMLSALLVLRKKSQEIGGKVVLCGLRPRLREVFEITKLHKLMDFAETEQEALGCFGISS